MKRIAVTLLFWVTVLLSGPVLSQDEWQYTVVSGDTLSRIAERHLDNPSSWRTLQKLNRIADPNKLTPGSIIRIPNALGAKNVLTAEVAWSRGQVEQMSKDGANPLKVGDQLRPGDIVATGPSSSVTLRFADESRILIGSSSRVVLTRMQRDPKSDQVMTTVTLENGTAESIVQRSEKLEARYEIRTPTMNLAVRGTRFRVMVDSVTGMTRSEVTEGSVAASSKGKEIVVAAGQGTFATKGEPPASPRNLIAPPSLVSPATALEALPIRFDWDSDPDARQFRIELLDGAGERQVDELTSLDRIVRWAALPDGDYQIRIRGIDAVGMEGKAASHQFRIKSQPAPPVLRWPVANVAIEGERVAFRWARPGGIQSYRLQVSDREDFSTIVAQMRQLPGGVGGIDVALPPGRYFWRIASATKEAGLGPESAVESFELRAGTGIAVPPATQIALSWRKPSQPLKTQFQVALSPDFRTPLIDTTSAGNQAEFQPVGKGPYFVRLRRIDVDGLATPFEATQQLTLPEVR